MPTAEDAERIRRIIEIAEKKTGKQLTRSAREMLAIPIEEVINFVYEPNWPQIESSVIKTVAHAEPDEFAPTKLKYNARSIIAAFYKNFCNIPPFCGPVEKGDR